MDLKGIELSDKLSSSSWSMNIMNTQLAYEVNKLLVSQWFGKNVRELMCGRNIGSLNNPDWIFSQMRWQSSSMCFVYSWKNGLAEICKASLLSQCRIVGCEWETCKSLIRKRIHVILQLAVAMARYSASAEERDTVVRFLDYQEIKESPSMVQNPVVECLVIGQLPQSESR